MPLSIVKSEPAPAQTATAAPKLSIVKSEGAQPEHAGQMGFMDYLTGEAKGALQAFNPLALLKGLFIDGPKAKAEQEQRWTDEATGKAQPHGSPMDSLYAFLDNPENVGNALGGVVAGKVIGAPGESTALETGLRGAGRATSATGRGLSAFGDVAEHPAVKTAAVGTGIAGHPVVGGAIYGVPKIAKLAGRAAEGAGSMLERAAEGIIDAKTPQAVTRYPRSLSTEVPGSSFDPNHPAVRANDYSPSSSVQFGKGGFEADPPLPGRSWEPQPEITIPADDLGATTPTSDTRVGRPDFVERNSEFPMGKPEAPAPKVKTEPDWLDRYMPNESADVDPTAPAGDKFAAEFGDVQRQPVSQPDFVKDPARAAMESENFQRNAPYGEGGIMPSTVRPTEMLDQAMEGLYYPQETPWKFPTGEPGTKPASNVRALPRRDELWGADARTPEGETLQASPSKANYLYDPQTPTSYLREQLSTATSPADREFLARAIRQRRNIELALSGVK